MHNDRSEELCHYRINEAGDTLRAATSCYSLGLYKDAINRSYYAAFYAIKAVLALGKVDFKRHKDVVAYFNKEYVATGIFEKDMGRKLARLQQLREKSDYDDFFIASKEQAESQIETAQLILNTIKEYLKK